MVGLPTPAVLKDVLGAFEPFNLWDFYALLRRLLHAGDCGWIFAYIKGFLTDVICAWRLKRLSERHGISQRAYNRGACPVHCFLISVSAHSKCLPGLKLSKAWYVMFSDVIVIWCVILAPSTLSIRARLQRSAEKAGHYLLRVGQGLASTRSANFFISPAVTSPPFPGETFVNRQSPSRVRRFAYSALLIDHPFSWRPRVTAVLGRFRHRLVILQELQDTN